ncbi:MAG: hypothetical protein ABFD07_11345 [Methanobacterium sp.]
MNEVIRTERGWAGHFICADRCWFRRNTLLECGEERIIVSTVGEMTDISGKNFPNFVEVGHNRYYETMAFHAQRVDDRYWDADIQRPVNFESPWAISELNADDEANDMHEAVVDEIIIMLRAYDGHKILNKENKDDNGK